MANAVVGTKEFASRSNGIVAVKEITTDGAGAGSVAHGMTNEDGSAKTPVVAYAIPMSGDDFGTLAVTVTSTNIVLANGGNAKKWVVVAFG